MGYQERDWEIIDYQIYSLNDTGLPFRGPKPQTLEPRNYFVCIGAAQTFGCFCTKPYPVLLEKKLNFPSLNLGSAGAGPYFFLKQQQLMPYINNAKFAIVQVMSGRSESNQLFDSGGREYLTRRSDGVKIGADAAYEQLLKETNIKFVREIVAETRQNWVDNFKNLLQQIEVPKILFWFSNRHPVYQEKYTSAYSLFGSFPQLVNQSMVKQIRKYSHDYVECISTRGRYQLLISRFTNKPTIIDPGREDLRALYGNKQKYNKYYPSPEMHVDATEALEKICKKYL